MKSKILTALLSVIVAFGLWAYVVTNVSVEDTTTLHNVPVVFQNEGALTGRKLILTDGASQTVSLTITGTRGEILKLHPSNVSVVVDLSGIYDAGRQSVQYTVNYPADVNSSDFEYTADKSRIPLTVEDLVEKPVSVVISWTGKVAENYVAEKESVELDYRYVTVSGPASVVDRIDRARIQVDLEGLTASLDQDYAYVLCDSEGNVVEVPDVALVTTNVEQIHLKMPIQRIKEVTLKVNVISGGGATEETSSIVLDTQTITVSGTDEALAQVSDPLVIGTINLAETKGVTNTTFPIELPEGVTNLTGVDVVNVSISFPALTTKTFTINNIQAVNIPAGLEGTVVTKQISVTVRGPQSLVQRMKATDITVTVDFGNIEINATEQVNPTVTVSSNYFGVGVLENGKVTISLREPIPEPTEETEPQEAE